MSELLEHARHFRCRRGFSGVHLLASRSAYWIVIGTALTLVFLCGCAGNIPGPKETARYETAVGLYEQGNYDGAMKELRHILIRYPLWPDASLLYAKSARATRTVEGRRLAAITLSKIMVHRPDRVDLRRELASLNFEQGFYAYARAHYQALLKVDDNDSDAHYMLGVIIERDWRRYHSYKDLSRVITELNRAIELDSTNVDSFRRLALAYLEKEDQDSFEVVAFRLLNRTPSEPDALLLSAVALHLKARYAEELGKWEEFFSASGAAGSAPFEDITLLLTPSQKRRLERLDRSDQDKFVRNFWRELDPTPVTELNERLLEHWFRVGLTRLLFSDEKTGLPPWETCRGQVLIRYGIAEQKQYSVVVHERGESPGMPALVWHYTDQAGPLRVTFVDYALTGDYAYLEFSRFPSELDARLYYCPASYEHDYGAESYESRLAAAGFWRETGVREEFYVGVPLERVSGGDWKRVPVEFVLFDTLWNEVARVSTTLESATMFASSTGSTLVQELDLSLAPGRYVAAVEVRDSVSGTVGIARENIDVPAFRRDTLGVSEIELAYIIPAPHPSSGIAKDEGILPNPSGIVGESERLWLYYEVYNLARGTDGKSRFAAKYSIVPSKKKGSSFWEFIGSIFGPGEHYILSTVTRQVEGPSSSEQVAVDISSLSKGSYRLVLEVRDLVNGFKVETERSFEKVGARKSR